MNQAYESLPDRPLKRFILGFSTAGTVAFIILFIHGDTLKEGFIFGAIAMILAGFICGIISAFGKKMIHAIMTIAGEFLSNP